MKAIQLQTQAEQTLLLKHDRTQTGLLLGQSWDHRVHVLACVATPALPKSASGGGGGWNRTDWFLEHARQVRRMLVGGVELVGMYVSDTNGERLRAFESDGAMRDMLFGLPLSPCSLDRILLRAGAGGKMSADAYSGGKKDAIKPKPVSSIRTANVAASLVVFETTLQLDVTVPVQPAAAGGGSASAPLKLQLRRGLEPFQTSVLAAQALINGAPVDPALVIDKAFDTDGGAGGTTTKGKGKGGKAAKKSTSSSGKDASASASASSADSSAVQSVELFLRPSVAAPADPSAAGTVRLHGSVQCRVYAHNKSSVGQALASLRHDVINSLHSRLQLLCEDSEDATGAFDLPAEGESAFQWQLPRRLFVPVAGGACVCDYLLPGETADDGAQRVAELLAMPPHTEGAPFTREQCAEEIEGHAHADRQSGGSTDAGSSAVVPATAGSSSGGAKAGATVAVASSPSSTAGPTSGLMLPIAFGVLALALSAAFLTQIM